MSIKPVALEISSLKTLTAVEAEANRSHQHELQGVNTLKSIFGVKRQKFTAYFSLRGSADIYTIELTWYDAREGKPNRSPEYRLYFQPNPVMDHAKEGDDLLVGVTKNKEIHCELISR